MGETPGVSSVRLIAAVPDAVGAGVGSAAVGIGTGASPSIARFAQLADLPVDAGGIVAGGPSRMACATLFLYFSGLSRNLTAISFAALPMSPWPIPARAVVLPSL